MSGDQSKLQTGVKAMQAGHLTQMTFQGEREIKPVEIQNRAILFFLHLLAVL